MRLPHRSILLLLPTLCLIGCDGDDHPIPPGKADCPVGVTCVCPGDFVWLVDKEPVTVADHPSWKSTLSGSDDPFVVYGETDMEPRWAKFTILLKDPSTVYFQNGRDFVFHYDWASRHLGAPYEGMSSSEFEQVTLHQDGQLAVTGAVLFGYDNAIGIQFERLDAYHPEMVIELFEIVTAKIEATPESEFLYMPTGSQAADIDSSLGCLIAGDVKVGSPTRWLKGDACYSTGWAFGRAVFVASDEIEDAFSAGTLTSSDILLTNGVPAEIPRLAGVVSSQPTTPNSHVALLSQTFGVPFTYLRDGEERIQGLNGKEVILRVRPIDVYGGYNGDYGCEVDLVDVDGTIDADARAALDALRAVDEVDLTPKAPLGALSVNVDDLEPDDIRHVGGKAANFGMLRRSIPDNSPQAIALSIDLFDEFMGQTLPNGSVLREFIDTRLAGHSFPPEIASLEADLDTIRHLIKDDTEFTGQQREAIISALAPFDPTKKIRFRSSTNMEDSDTFTGAGLYDSYSGCLADDLDGDDVGPSLCDPSREKERGVFRAIRRVYASFYNDNAVIERLRYGVSEDQVGMGVLVHYSFPDETEMANGVVTVHVTDIFNNYKIVSQTGASSITNPDGNSQPEVMNASAGFGNVAFELRQRSSLLLIGETVLDLGPDGEGGEYEELVGLLERVKSEYMANHPGLEHFVLDFEFKHIAPGELIVKQVRRVPRPTTEPTLTPFMVPGTVDLCIDQGEASDVFGMHRLKSQWQLEMGAQSVTPANATALIDDSEVELLADSGTNAFTGAPESWPNSEISVADDGYSLTVTHAFRNEALTPAADVELRAHSPRKVSVLQTPIVFPGDLRYELFANYADDVSGFESYNGTLTQRRDDHVQLTADCAPEPMGNQQFLPVQTEVTRGGATVSVDFNLRSRGGFEKTASLGGWETVTIEGLTSQPISIGGDYARSFRPAHHNFFSTFLFDPVRDPDIPAASLDELAAEDIKLIIVEDGGDQIILVDSAGSPRAL